MTTKEYSFSIMKSRKASVIGAKRPKGFRGILSPCPTGAVTKRLGMNY